MEWNVMNINDRLDGIVQNSDERSFRENLFAEIGKDIGDDVDQKFIYGLYFQLISQSVKQFGLDETNKNNFFKKLSGNKLYSENLLSIFKILCQAHKKEDQRWLSDLVIGMFCGKTDQDLLRLLEWFVPFKRRLYTLLGTNNEQIQYCKIELEFMSITHRDKNEMILCSSANTCKTGSLFQMALDSLFCACNVSEAKLNSDELVELIDKAATDVSGLGKILHIIELNNTGNVKLSMPQNDIRSVISSFQSKPMSKFWNVCKYDFGLNVFNMCIRGKGSADTDKIDATESNNILCRLNRGLNDNDKLKIHRLKNSCNGTNFLFDQVSEENGTAESYHYEDSVLNDNGKQITERVLGLLLPSGYKLINENEGMSVERSEGNKTKYKKIADKINEIKKLRDKYCNQSIEYSKLEKKYKNENNAEKEKEMRLEKEKYKRLSETPEVELQSAFDSWLLEFCPPDCPKLPDSESEFRKKLEIDTNSYRQLRECFKKTFSLSGNISKEMFDDMLAVILYQYTEGIQQTSEIYPDAERRNKWMENVRKLFVGQYNENGQLDSCAAGSMMSYAAKYFKFMDEFLNKEDTPSKVYNLPVNFFKYDENDPDIMYSPLNYIQVLIQTAAVLMKIDSADKETRKIFNRNANKLVWMFEDKSNKAKNYYQNLQTKINEYVSNHSNIKRQEVLVGLLCGGIKNFTKTKCEAICNMAHQITEFDLDDPMRKHATQLNFVRAKKKENGELVGCKLYENGILSVDVNLTKQLEMSRKFPPLIDELTECETEVEIKTTLDMANWDDLKCLNTEQFLKRLDNRVILDNIMYEDQIRPFLWSEHEYVKYIFGKSYSMKCAVLYAKFWVFTTDSTDLIRAFRWGFLYALMERIVGFFPCVFFLMLALIFYPFSRYNTNRIYRFIEQTVRTKLGDRVDDVNPDKDQDENKNQELKQNDLGEQESNDFLKDLDFDLFNIETPTSDASFQTNRAHIPWRK